MNEQGNGDGGGTDRADWEQSRREAVAAAVTTGVGVITARVCALCKKTARHLWMSPTGHEFCDTCCEAYTKREGYLLRAASAIRPEEVEWYLPGRVPLGSLTLLVGPAGLAKTTLALELSARGTRGLLSSPAADVVFATSEDSLAHTLVPRLIAAGAVLDRVHFITIKRDGIEIGLTLPEHTDELQLAVEETGAKLVVLDPVVGHLSGNIDSHKDHSVRRALAPLAALAESTGAAILGIGHLNKSHSTDVLTRLGGSVAFGAAARSVLLLSEDPDAVEGSPERLLIHAKCNLAPLAVAFRLKVEARTITIESREIGTSGIVWQGEDPTATAAKVLAGRQEPSRLAEAIDFLRDVLADGPLPTSQVKALAADEDITERTLKRAKKKLGIESKRKGFGPGSSVHWSPPKDAGIPHTGPALKNRPTMENRDPAGGQKTVAGQGISHTGSTPERFPTIEEGRPSMQDREQEPRSSPPVPDNSDAAGHSRCAASSSAPRVWEMDFTRAGEPAPTLDGVPAESPPDSGGQVQPLPEGG